MRILQINCTYAEGSTGKIVEDIHNLLKSEKINSFVAFPFGNSQKNNEIYTFSNRVLCKLNAAYVRLLGQKYDGAFIQSYNLLKIMKRINPDIVHLHCINGYDINVFFLLNYLAKNRIPTVFTLHAEFPFTGNCGHAYDCEKWKTGCGNCPNLREATRSVFFDTTAITWNKFKRSYLKFNQDRLVFTAVSPWLNCRAQQSPLIKRFNIRTIINGIDTQQFHYYDDALALKVKLGIGSQEKVIFHATAGFDPFSDNLKGAKYVLCVAKELKKVGVRLIVAANTTTMSDENEDIIFVGKISSKSEMARYYSMADMTLVTSKRETFSMVTAESLCCGTPVVGFKAGGPESIALPDYSTFVDYGNSSALVDECVKMLSRTIDKRNLSSVAKKMYSCNSVYKQYIELYNELYSEHYS